MSTKELLFIPPALAALGAGLLVNTALTSVVDLFRYLPQWRHQRAVDALSRVMGEQEEETGEVLSEEKLYGAPDVTIFIVIAFFLGILTSWTVLNGPMRLLGALAGVVPLIWKRRWLDNARQEARGQIADLITELRLRLVFSGSLGAALRELASEEREGIVWERLHEHQDLLAMSGADAALEALANEFHNAARELNMLLRRLHSAQQGSGSYAVALRKAAEEAMEEVYRRAQMEVEGAPVRVLLPMLLFLFAPILVLVAYPMLAKLMTSITTGGLPAP